MRRSLSPRTIIIAFVVIAGGLVGAVINLDRYFNGKGAVTVFGPPGGRLTVTVDGTWVDTLAPGAGTKVELPQGPHQVTLASGVTQKSFPLEVNSGTFHRVLPFGEQCFALFDVTNAVYSTGLLGGLLQQKVTVEQRFCGPDAFDFPSESYLKISQMPQRLQAGRRVRLLQSIPCADLQAPDAALIAAITP